MNEGVKGWKVMDEKLQCRGHQFKVGKTYEVKGDVVMCQNGWHFHHDASHLFNYCTNTTKNRVCEVIGYDVVTDMDKSACRRIEIVRELGLFEICHLIGGNGNGDGDGNGNGDGYGNGNGDGYGDGDGDGNGNGYGDGDGYGNGNGKYTLPDFIQFGDAA